MSFQTAAVELDTTIAEEVEPGEHAGQDADEDGREDADTRCGKVDGERHTRERGKRAGDEVHDFAVAGSVQRGKVRADRGVRVPVRVMRRAGAFGVIAAPHPPLPKEEKEEGRKQRYEEESADRDVRNPARIKFAEYRKEHG